MLWIIMIMTIYISSTFMAGNYGFIGFIYKIIFWLLIVVILKSRSFTINGNKLMRLKVILNLDDYIQLYY